MGGIIFDIMIIVDMFRYNGYPKTGRVWDKLKIKLIIMKKVKAADVANYFLLRAGMEEEYISNLMLQ